MLHAFKPSKTFELVCRETKYSGEDGCTSEENDYDDKVNWLPLIK